MTIITLHGLSAALGIPAPLIRGTIAATRWASQGAPVLVSGADVVFPATVRVQLVDGEPAEALDLPPSTAEFCYKLTVSSLAGGTLGPWFVAVPEGGPVDIGDLVRVDPATFEPLPVEVSAAWDAALGQAQGAATAAAGSADDAAEAALAADFSAQQAAGHATAAQQAATQAGASAFNAGSSAAAAQSSEDDARAAATAAAGSASAAAGSASAASGSATAAATSAESAASAVTAAQAARTGAETARTGAEAAQAGMVTGGTIDGSGHLILSKLGGGTIDAGNATVPGPPGNPTAYELRGTGFPEGVVTAPVGTYYTDTAATNGAIRWVKVTGSGNTGWRVIFGDTGNRNVTSVITAGGGLTFDQSNLHRSGQVVKLALINADGTIGTVYSLPALPAGFRLVQSTIEISSGYGIDGAGSVGGVLSCYGGKNLTYVPRASGKISMTLMGIAADPWPSTLPGTPA